jgi:hypothetical protein
MVVQQNNFHEMSEFVRLGQRFKVDTVYFHQLVNWGTFSDEEYQARAIHQPSHAQHAELVALLQDPVFSDPVVYLSNLTSIRQVGVAAR